MVGFAAGRVICSNVFDRWGSSLWYLNMVDLVAWASGVSSCSFTFCEGILLTAMFCISITWYNLSLFNLVILCRLSRPATLLYVGIEMHIAGYWLMFPHWLHRVPWKISSQYTLKRSGDKMQSCSRSLFIDISSVVLFSFLNLLLVASAGSQSSANQCQMSLALA